MKSTIIPLLLLSLTTFSQTQITPADLQLIIGSWEGSLTYLDYQTNEPFTMPANLEVKEGKDGYSLELENIYPNEPKANNSSKIKISKDGTMLNKSTVTSREELENGEIKIQTESEGKDDNKNATIRYTYLFSQKEFSIRKDVRFSEEGNWIKRSEFKYNRKE